MKACKLHRKSGLWAVDTVNPSAWPAAHDYLAVTSADACLVQELRCAPGRQVVKAELDAARIGWQLAASPAVVTAANRNSAGTATAVRAHHGLARSTLDDLPPVYRARCTIRWWGAYAKGGVHLSTVYPWDTEGPSERNLEPLQLLGRKLTALHGPWILAGDFTMTPQHARCHGLARAG
jgi:hypothetical protein